MKVAVVGSRSVIIDDLDQYLPSGVTEIVSGGAEGVDTCAREYAVSRGLKLTEFLPEYERYGSTALFRRNQQIVDYADSVIAFWDGSSPGTRAIIRQCMATGVDVTVHYQ